MLDPLRLFAGFARQDVGFPFLDFLAFARQDVGFPYFDFLVFARRDVGFRIPLFRFRCVCNKECWIPLDLLLGL